MLWPSELDGAVNGWEWRRRRRWWRWWREKDFGGTGLLLIMSLTFFLGLANWQTIESLMTFKFSVCPGAVAAVFAVYSIKNVHL